MAATVFAWSATVAGWRHGSGVTMVPRVNRVVACATRPRVTQTSYVGPPLGKSR